MANKETERSTKILSKNIAPMVVKELDNLRTQRQLSRIARETGVNVSRWSDIALGKIPLTAYYLGHLIQKGIIDVSEHITQGKDINNFSIDERRLLRKLEMGNELVDMLEDRELEDILVRASRQGKDVKAILRMMIGE